MSVSYHLALAVFIGSLVKCSNGSFTLESPEQLSGELSLLQLRAQARRSAGGVDSLPANVDLSHGTAANVVIDSSLDAMLHSIVKEVLAAAHDARAAGADEEAAALLAAEATAREEGARLSPGGDKGPAPALLEASSALAEASGGCDDCDGKETAPVQKMAGLGSCGPDFPSNIEDCSHVDFGSCGNACCNMLMTVPFSPAKAMAMLNKSLSDGGPDGRYHLEMSVEGPVGFANLTDFAQDLPEPFSKSTSGVFIGQARHETIGNFNDTVNFNLIATKKGDTLLHAFSLSLVAGALGDNGQNYKNVISPMKAAFGDDFKLEARLLNSCPSVDALLGPRISKKED